MPTEYLDHGGTVCELLSFYSLPDDAWSIELADMSGDGGSLAHVLVPDEDMDRPCEVTSREERPAGMMGICNLIWLGFRVMGTLWLGRS